MPTARAPAHGNCAWSVPDEAASRAKKLETVRTLTLFDIGGDLSIRIG